jgi:hypothetical protein
MQERMCMEFPVLSNMRNICLEFCGAGCKEQAKQELRQCALASLHGDTITIWRPVGSHLRLIGLMGSLLLSRFTSQTSHDFVLCHYKRVTKIWLLSCRVSSSTPPSTTWRSAAAWMRHCASCRLSSTSRRTLTRCALLASSPFHA